MSMAHRCRSCERPLALADLVCSACGEPVSAEDRRRLFLGRAESLAEAEQFAEAARALEGVLQQALPAEEGRLLWRKRGVWLLRAQRPELLDAAEAALAEALRLNDSDDLSHQLWIDLLAKRGSLEKAKAWYVQRLQLRPEDAMAVRQLQIIKLSTDFKTQAPPKLNLPAAEGKGFFYRLIRPSRSKTAAAGLGLVLNGGLMLKVLIKPFGTAGGDSLIGGEQLGSLVQLLNDPWLPGIQAGICAGYLVWAWVLRRG